MSDRAMCQQLLNRLPDFKIRSVLVYLQELCVDEEAEDDAFCRSLYEDYLADGSPDKHQTISLEELASELGVNL